MRTGLFVLAALVVTVPASAQDDYGIGATQDVPRVEAGTITLDGNADEAAWDDAPEIDLTANWNSGFYDECAPNGDGEVDILSSAKLLYTEGALFVYVSIQDYQEFYFGGPGQPFLGEQIYVGVDLTHEEDDQIDEDYAGWPDNAPDVGPTVYKISGAPGVGITSNWGFNDIFPADSGWVAGQVFVDNDTFQWGVEMAIYGDEIGPGQEIGFNIGGAAGEEACATSVDDAYAYYSWQAFEPSTAGGDVNNNSASYATLALAGGTAAGDGPDARTTALRAGYPNPFRAETTFRYTLDAPGHVRLAVYDVLGREVAVLEDGPRSAGPGHVAWTPSGAPAGVYLARLQVDGAPQGTTTVQLAR